MLVVETETCSLIYDWSLVSGCNPSYYACNHISLFHLECVLGRSVYMKVLCEDINMKHIYSNAALFAK
jgi:hypothetical protein